MIVWNNNNMWLQYVTWIKFQEKLTQHLSDPKLFFFSYGAPRTIRNQPSLQAGNRTVWWIDDISKPENYEYMKYVTSTSQAYHLPMLSG